MSREWVINSYSGYQGLVLQDCDRADAGPGEVRLAIEAFALNWGDADLMLDNYSFSFESFPARIGMEAAGIVDQIGEGVDGIEIGERYCTLPHFYFNKGASAESVVVDARYVTKAPASLSAVEASSIWMQYLTAYYPIVEISEAGPGKTILVPAATSTAGYAALQLGKLKGATMIGTTRSADNIDCLEQGGASHVIVDQGKDDLAEMLMQYSSDKGIDAAFDPIGAGMMNRYSKALAQDARIYLYGWLDGEVPTIPTVDMIKVNAIYHPYSVFHYIENPEKCQRGISYINEAIAAGNLSPLIDRVFPMEGYRDAWDYLRHPRKDHGKVVVAVTENAESK